MAEVFGEEDKVAAVKAAEEIIKTKRVSEMQKHPKHISNFFGDILANLKIKPKDSEETNGGK